MLTIDYICESIGKNGYGAHLVDWRDDVVESQRANISTVWRRIVDNEGKTFRQKLGQEFIYTIKGNAIVPSTTKWSISISSFEKALKYVPLKNTAIIQKSCYGPSYVFAILMDQRIRNGLWYKETLYGKRVWNSLQNMRL